MLAARRAASRGRIFHGAATIKEYRQATRLRAGAVGAKQREAPRAIAASLPDRTQSALRQTGLGVQRETEGQRGNHVSQGPFSAGSHPRG